MAKALQPARVKEVRIDEMTGTAMVIVPDHQLSLAIGKEGQNARLAGRLTGWAIDIKSETQLAEAEAAFAEQDWAEGEWVVDEETGEQVWQPAEGGPAVSATEYLESAEDAPEEGEEAATDEAATDPRRPADEGDAAPDEPDETTEELHPETDLSANTGEADDMEVGDDPVERAQPDVPAGEEPAGVAEEEAVHETAAADQEAEQP